MSTMQKRNQPEIPYGSYSMATKLVPNPDFFLILKEVPESILTNEKTGAAVAKLGVQKACLIKYSSYFRGILPSGRFTNERDDNDIHLDVNEIFINNLILEIIHGVENQGFNRYERSRMKDILLECTHWGVDHIILSGWFTGWCAFASAADLLVCREHLSQGKLCACVEQQLLFPTYAFNHRALFMELTLRLVQYSSGRFHEDTYSEKPELMIPGRIIKKINGARSGIRGRLEKKLKENMKKALDTKCACRHRFIKGFYRELKKLGYYPGLELVTWKRPVLEVIHNLKENWKFDFRCESCGGVDINEIFNIGDYAFQGFQGLCLDCVGKPRLTNDVHDAMDYPLTCRNSDMESIIWDEGCACRHGASTWRFSFFAREWSENIQDEGAFDIFEDVVQT